VKAYLKLLGKIPSVNRRNYQRRLKLEFAPRRIADLNLLFAVYSGQPIESMIESKAKLRYSV
jgi:hypothetical protein